MKQGILFDVDGTLWDSAPQVTQAWNEVLAACPEVNRTITVQDMYRYMGHPMDEIARMMLGDMEEGRRMALMERCMAYENQYLETHPGTFYPGVKEIMTALKEQGLELFIVSNCQDGYIQVMLKTSDLAPLIQDIECFGRTGLPKGRNISLVMERNGLKQAVYVGDTQMDAQASAQAGIPFIWASYGFGKASSPDGVIQSLKELPKALKKIWTAREEQS